MPSSVYTVGDVNSAINSQTGYPFIDLFYNATKSYSGTNAMCSIVIINLTASAIALLATASRQLWSFARNKGVPFSNWLAPTVLPQDIPLNALFVTLAIAILLSLINIGSNAALQAIFSISSSSLLTSYIITIGSIINWRIRNKHLPKARFSLGRWGLWINVAAICFLIPWFIFSFFPNFVSPTPQTMNYGSLMYGSVVIFASVYYLVYGRHSYQPPTEQVKKVMVGTDAFDIALDRFETEQQQQQVSIIGK
jgi:amino acid transporter